MSLDGHALAQRVKSSDRRALAKAITLLESRRTDQRRAADALLRDLIPDSGRSIRLGVSGPPGVGKSTFIEALGQKLVASGRRLAILAIDPSSPLSGGSILGDRTRMEELSRHPEVFIRPSPTGGTLGGVARRTREAIIACEAGGFDTIIIETVGVGQSETTAASMVDAFLTLHLPNAGDELQGIKRGILELADAVAVTKADGPFANAAHIAKNQLERALMLARGQSAHAVPVIAVSSTEGRGLDELWGAITDFIERQKASDRFDARRRQQALEWFRSELGELLHTRLWAGSGQSAMLASKEAEVLAGKIPASVAAAEAIDTLLAAFNLSREQSSANRS
jgi:LAO/AO transport system kinase